MADRIDLVQGDTLPEIEVVIRDDVTGEPIDISGAVVRLKFRESGSATVKAVLIGEILNGFQDADGSVSTAAPYDAIGRGGRVKFTWESDTLDTAGSFEGEVELTLDGSSIQTVYDRLKFRVREEF